MHGLWLCCAVLHALLTHPQCPVALNKTRDAIGVSFVVEWLRQLLVGPVVCQPDITEWPQTIPTQIQGLMEFAEVDSVLGKFLTMLLTGSVGTKK